jgi:hypothetical protein
VTAAAVCLVALCHADPVTADSDRAGLLGAMITHAAHRAGIPAELLAAVVWVESRRWPWALNVRGRPVYPRSRADAVAILRRLGHDEVDVGYAQIHAAVWSPVLGLTAEALLDPWTNLQVAALILRRSLEQEPGWGGVGRYHSATPWRKWGYAARVAQTWRHLRPSGPARGDRTP